MRRLLLPLLAAVALVSCGGSDGDDSSDSTSASDASSAETTSDDDASDATTADESAADETSGNSPGDVDCDEIDAAVAEVGVPLQLMAQVRDPENLQSIKDGVMGPFDVDAFLAAIAQLRVLEAYDSPLGDPGESLDAYEDAGVALKALFAKEAATQADIDEYNTHVGEVGAFLGHQMAIAGALDQVGC